MSPSESRTRDVGSYSSCLTQSAYEQAANIYTLWLAEQKADLCLGPF